MIHYIFIYCWTRPTIGALFKCFSVVHLSVKKNWTSNSEKKRWMIFALLQTRNPTTSWNCWGISIFLKTVSTWFASSFRGFVDPAPLHHRRASVYNCEKQCAKFLVRLREMMTTRLCSLSVPFYASVLYWNHYKMIPFREKCWKREKCRHAEIIKKILPKRIIM